MNRLTVAILLVASIVVLSAVKTRATDLPNLGPDSNKADLRDSVNDSKDEFKQIVDYMMRTGVDAHYGEHLAPHVGLSGATPVKGHNIRDRKLYEERGGLDFAVAYEESSEATMYDGKRPICVFLSVAKISGQDSESRYYRLSLDGHLEKVALIHGKNDENGKGVRGSAVWFDEDINSPQVKEAFQSEMADVRSWFKHQQAVAAEKAAAAAAQ